MAVQPVEPVGFVGPEELQAERNRLLARLEMGESDLLQGGDTWTLDSEEQWRAYDRLKGIRFLLGEDD
ncbi:MAG: hypothetical protein Q4F67_06515 [Propionibacteriaceae bacterium]|nr:hypothetical protein [Propionibacteriaceae bacterium]